MYSHSSEGPLGCDTLWCYGRILLLWRTLLEAA